MALTLFNLHYLIMANVRVKAWSGMTTGMARQRKAQGMKESRLAQHRLVARWQRTYTTI